MIPNFTEEEFKAAKSKDLLELTCVYCNGKFKKTKHRIKQTLNPNDNRTANYCSLKCCYINKNSSINVTCKNCNVEFKIFPYKYKKRPYYFCSQSCSATHNNKNKTYGTRRSKLEKWLEEQLTLLYPNLQMDFNKKTVIGSELDIYIPSLNLAFELNGIFHYEPIYGINKLEQV
jgi:hypothetical protein